MARINWLECADVRETSLTKEQVEMVEEIMTMTMKYQVTDILTYGLKKTRLKTLQLSPTVPGVEQELVKNASDVIPILEIWN